MSQFKRFNSLMFTCFALLLFSVLLSSLSTEVFAQETFEEDLDYFMGILILESQQQSVLDSIKKVKDLQLGNMVILHPLDQAWNLTLIEEAIRTANTLGLYTIFETYNFTAHDIQISPEQFAAWKARYPLLLGIIVQEVTGKQIDSRTWVDNSTGTIKTRLQAEREVIANLTSSMKLPDFKNNGAKIFLQENVVSYTSANTSYCDVLVTKVFNAPNTELMIGLTRGMKNSYDIPEWGLWVDTWREWIKPPAFTPNDVERALYEGWFYGAKYFFFEQGNFFGTLDRDWPNKYIILGQDGKLTEYGKVIQRFYSFLHNQKNLGSNQPDYHSSIAVMIGQSGWSGRGSDWGFWEQSDRQADFDYALLNLFFPGIGDNWQIGEALTGKEFTGLPLGMVDIISVYAPPSVLKQYKVIVGLGWSQISKTIVDTIEEYVQDGGIFFSLLTFTHSNKDIDDLESAFAWTKSFDGLFGVHVATFVESGFNIKSDVQLHNITFTEDTFWYPWKGKTYNYADFNQSGSWFWNFKYELNPGESTKVIAWVNGEQDDTKAFIVENQNGEGYTYVLNTRNPNSLPDGVLSDVLTDFVYFLCAHHVQPMTYVIYPENEYWLCQGQTDNAVYLMHDNSTTIETFNYSILHSEASLIANKDFIVYDYINNEYYGETEIPVSYLNVTLKPNEAKLYLFLENDEIPQVIHSEALLTEAPLFLNQHLTVALEGIEETTNITKIYCGDFGQPKYILGTAFNLTQEYDPINKFVGLTSNSNLTLSWDYTGNFSVFSSTVSLVDVSWNQFREILSVSTNGIVEQQGVIQLQTGGAKPYYFKVDGKESSKWSYDISTGVMSVGFTFVSDTAELVFGFKPIEIDRVFVSDERVDVGSVQNIGFHLLWMSNGSDVDGANVNVNGAEYETNNTGWISVAVISTSVGRIDLKLLGISVNGLMDFAKTVNDPYIIYDRVNVTNSTVIEKLAQVGSSQDIWLTAEYEYDSVTYDGSKGTIFLNDNPMIWSDQNGRWEQPVTSEILGPHIYEATSVNDEVYGLTSVHNLARKMEITWDKLEITKIECETKTLGLTNVKIYVVYDYTNKTVVGADVSMNGKQCNEIEPGVYACEISDWSPVQSYLITAVIPDFEQAKRTVLNIHVLNTLIYTLIALAIVLPIGIFILRKKRSKQGSYTASSGMSLNTRLLSLNFGKKGRVD